MKLSHIFTNDIKSGHLFKIPEQPINVILDVTNFCNNYCLFCYNSSDSAYRNDKPDAASLKQIVSILGEHGTGEILYLGGEPFSFHGLHEILRTGSKYGMFQRAVSNGSFLKGKNVCLDLKESGLDEVGISFHSSLAATHDKLSGRKGSFNDALVAVENCLNAGISTFIQYSPTQLNSKQDILELAKYISELFGNSIIFFDINRLLPLGHGRLIRDIFIEGDDWFLFLCEASSLYHLGYDVHAELTPFCWLNHKAEVYNIQDEMKEAVFKMNRGCFMWVAQLALDFKGRIKFCPAGLSVGPSILEVRWPDFWTDWTDFKQYRSFLWNNKCVDLKKEVSCSFFNRCLGGCKYSKGIHYEIDRYAMDFRKYNWRGIHEKI